jgi:hypothetical protein
MKYALVYPNAAAQMLTACYLTARADGLADAVTQATNRIDAVLRANPLDQGESREGESRLLIDRPLSVEYEVFEDERVVVVLTVRYRP